MKIVFNFIIFTIIIVALYLLGNLIEPKLIELATSHIGNKIVAGLIALSRAVLIMLWLLGITYKSIWDKKTFKRTNSLVVWILTVIVLFVGISFALLILDRTNKLYRYTKNSSYSWKGKLYQSDTVLGYKSIPDAKGFDTFPVGENVPIRFDKKGFRVPLSYNDTTETKKVSFLCLGCSFTFGSACLAEESFPYLVSQETGKRSINAGTCGYGISQMLLLSKELIPCYKPDFVIVQYSPWLVQRSINMDAPSFLSRIPTPYISKNKNGENLVAPRIFNSKTFEVNMDKYRNTKSGIKDYICFLFEIGMPLYLYNGYYTGITTVKRVLGLIPSPNKDIKDVEQFVYSNIYQICKESNATMIILNLGDIKYTSNSHNLTFPDSGVIFAEADSLLFRRLKSPDDYNKEYKNWYFDGRDSILKDPYHPNPKAHKIIAESIIKALDKIETEKRDHKKHRKNFAHRITQINTD
ncbi:MAG: hypothetical protein PHX21_06080 [bacterium]|nr:hypothetical protein [bacterium]